MTTCQSKNLIDYNDTNPSDASNEDNLTTFIVDGFWGERLDKVLASQIPTISRARLQKWVEEGAVKVNGEVCTKIRQKVSEGDEVEVAEQPLPEELAFTAQPIDVDVIYEDDQILIVNKPVGLVVHPAAGHWDDTLLNGLLYHYPCLKTLPRAGIVHRLDRETSGLMVVAKTLVAQTDLVRQLQARSVKREYWAMTIGTAADDFEVETPIGRDPKSPIKFTTFPGSIGVRAKPAHTRIKAVQWSECEGVSVSWVACRLQTGRTHQIRVHLASVDLPLIGEPLYRGRAPGVGAKVANALDFQHQALHASRLGLIHPTTREHMEWFVEPPEDMIELMKNLGFGPWDEPCRVFDEDDEE